MLNPIQKPRPITLNSSHIRMQNSRDNMIEGRQDTIRKQINK